jgi:hypothetical protein
MPSPKKPDKKKPNKIIMSHIQKKTKLPQYAHKTKHTLIKHLNHNIQKNNYNRPNLDNSQSISKQITA